MKTALIGGIIGLLLVFIAGGSVYVLRERLAERDKTIAEQQRAISVLTAAGDGKDATIKELEASGKRDETIVIETAAKIDQLSAHIDGLTRKTQEVLRHDPHLTLSSHLPAAAADALCLQWRAASGRGHGAAADHPRETAADAHAGTADPLAAGCGKWRQMTVADAVEWNGLLLRHAGLEREDKTALRRWAVEVGE